MSPAATKRIAKQTDPDRAGALKASGSKGRSTKSGVRESLRQASASASSSASASASSPASASAEPEWTAELDGLGKAFRRVFRSLNRLRGRDTHLGGSELSHAQFELLIELYERGELPAGELAAAARLTPATVTQMLEHLADRGHVERARSDTDRRVVVSRLTAQGKRKIEAKRVAWQERWRAALEGMEPSELRAATRVLECLSVVFEDVPAAESCLESSEGTRAKTA